MGGLPESPGTNIGAWQGLTIKEILEKVDLSNIIMEDDSKKQLAKDDPMVGHINPESAFLGPKLWSRPALTMPTSNGNEDYSVMNIDDFLSENGFDLNEGPESPGDSTDQEQSEIGIEIARPKATKVESGENTFLYVESKRAKMEREKEE